MSSFKSQIFFSGKIFNWRRLLLWVGGREYGGGGPLATSLLQIWKEKRIAHQEDYCQLYYPVTKPGTLSSKQKVVWLQGRSGCSRPVLCSDIECWRSLSLCALVSPSAEGGLWARLSFRPPKLKEIFNSDLSPPACQSAFQANRLAPLNGCFPHPPNWRYFIPERTVSSPTYPISFKVSSFYFEVQRKRRLCIMRMAPLKCSPCSCRLADSALSEEAIVMQMCSEESLLQEHFHGPLLYFFYYS